jgi:hypothetical protein
MTFRSEKQRARTQEKSLLNPITHEQPSLSFADLDFCIGNSPHKYGHLPPPKSWGYRAEALNSQEFILWPPGASDLHKNLVNTSPAGRSNARLFRKPYSLGTVALP